jgi:transcriptional regulator with PAS, ATPase and Fis domain
VLDKLVKDTRLRKEVEYYHARDAGTLDQLVGECRDITGLKTRIRRVVQMESTDGNSPPSILITGETGCGKELVARACHYESPRRDGPFIEVNCAAIPANLLESELFGHERGAFTDAGERKIGLIEAADGGTLFLDEIGEAEPAIQAKMLKVLEDQRIRRLGSVQERRVDVRVIAATNQLLEQRVTEGRFRADLLYRLRVIHFVVPPLRERGTDIGLLANRFLDQFARRYGKAALKFTPAAIAALSAYSWPGNVRELRNIVEQTVLIVQHDTIDATDLSLPQITPPAAIETAPTLAEGIELATVELDLIRQALEKTGWNITQAARMLGISRDTLRYRMEKHRLTRDA